MAAIAVRSATSNMTTSSTAPTAVTQFSNFVGRKSSLVFDEDDPPPFCTGARCWESDGVVVEVQPTTVHINVAAKYHRALVPVEQT